MSQTNGILSIQTNKAQGKQKMSQKGLGPHVRVRLPHPFWAWVPPSPPSPSPGLGGPPLPLRAFLCFEKVIKASTYPPWQVVLGSVIRRLNHLMIVHLHFAQIPQDCDLLPWWSSRRVTATTCLHSNWLLTTTLERSKHTHRNARTPSG